MSSHSWIFMKRSLCSVFCFKLIRSPSFFFLLHACFFFFFYAQRRGGCVDRSGDVSPDICATASC